MSLANTTTVAIVIPSHNGAATIVPLLSSLVGQAADTYRLISITVACDGCTDNTAAVAGAFAANHANIAVIDDRHRLGKSGRLNRFFQEVQTDVLIMIDDDVILDSRQTVAEIMRCFQDDAVGLAGGHDMPLPPRNFCQRVLFASDTLWHNIRSGLPGGDSVHNNPGRCMALRQQVCRRIQIPATVTADDEYIYLQTKQLGYNFTFATQARCYYELPDNFKDAFLQSSRHLQSKQDIVGQLGPEIEAAYRVPTVLKVRKVLELLPNQGVFLLLALMFQLSLRLFAIVHRWRPGEGTYNRIGSSMSS